MFNWIWNEKGNYYFVSWNPTIRADKNMQVFGGGGEKTTVYQAPAPQSVGAATREAIEAEIEMLPQRYETELEYRPKFAAVDLATIQQFAPDIMELGREFAREEKGLQEELYPGQIATEEALGEEIAGGVGAGIPPEVEAAFLDRFRAEEAAEGRLDSPVGSVNIARKMAGLGEQIRAQRMSEALSFTGRMPVLGSTQFSVARPQVTPTQTGQLTPAQLGYSGQTYGAWAGSYEPVTTGAPFDIRRYMPPISLGFSM